MSPCGLRWSTGARRKRGWEGSDVEDMRGLLAGGFVGGGFCRQYSPLYFSPFPHFILLPTSLPHVSFMQCINSARACACACARARAQGGVLVWSLCAWLVLLVLIESVFIFEKDMALPFTCSLLMLCLWM